MKKVFIGLFMAFILCLSLSAVAAKANASPASTISKKKDSQGFYSITTSSYLKTVGTSTIVLPDSFKKITIEGASLLYNNELLPADIVLNKKLLIVTPAEHLKNEATYSIRLFTSDDKQYLVNVKAYDLMKIDFTKDTLVLIPAKPEKGFHYPYYLNIPQKTDKSDYKRLIVEPNNTGSVNDSLGLHADYAKLDASGASLGGWLGETLNMPVLVPVFPRPLTNWEDNYYHTLSRDVMLQESGDGQRVDLQLIAMIKDAQELLASNGIKLEKKVFMTGFSASGQFVNRFTVLHPEWVRAVFHGGFTMYPIDNIDGNKLNFPLGVADIEEIVGTAFNPDEYKEVAQFVYTGDLDRNDKIVETIEDFNAYDAKVLHNLYQTEEPMGIWAKKEELMNRLGFGANIQFHIYQGIGHGIPTAAHHDAIEFFKANNEDDKIVKINPTKDAWYWRPELIKEMHD